MSEVKQKNVCEFIGEIKPNNGFPEGFELDYTRNGNARLTLNLCVSESYEANGEQKVRRTYIPVKAWGDKAEQWGGLLKKDALIKVIARYHPFTIIKNDEKVFRHEFTAFYLELLNNENGSSSNSTREIVNEVQAKKSTGKSQESEGQTSPDDIPF